jgi:hypothetical protein
MANYCIDSASIVRVLASHGHTHRCSRCDARMLVRHASNLCVDCWNGLRTGARAEAEAGEAERTRRGLDDGGDFVEQIVEIGRPAQET